MPQTRPKSASSSTNTGSTAALLAEQLRRAFEGEAWHGPAVVELLADVDAEMAAARPVAGVHSIWELLLHIAAWDDAVKRRIVLGKALQLNDAENFPSVADKSPAAWKSAIAHAKKAHAELLQTVVTLPDQRLSEQVPGKPYDIRFMLEGVIQHELYHAGQMAILKKAVKR